MTCVVLATECLTMYVAHNLQLVCSFLFIMLMQFILLLPFMVEGILSNWKLNSGNFSTHWNSLQVLSDVFCFIIFTHTLSPLLTLLNPCPCPNKWHFYWSWSPTGSNKENLGQNIWFLESSSSSTVKGSTLFGVSNIQ